MDNGIIKINGIKINGIMKTLNEYIKESLLDNEEELIDKIKSNLKDIEKIRELIKLPANVYHFVINILPNFYKKYKCKFEKTEVKNPHTGFLETHKLVKGFNKHKKYFLIEYASYREGYSSTIKAMNIYICHNGEILENYLCSIGNVRILNSYKKQFNGNITDLLENIKAVYEVPKDLEWLYEFIKEGKMLK
jgi:hypothetical protein